MADSAKTKTEVGKTAEESLKGDKGGSSADAPRKSPAKVEGGKYAPRTAQVEMGVHTDPLEAERAKLADDAGVTAPEYVDYEEALKNYESRDDVEPLAQRRAREAGLTFADAGFRRKGEGDGVVTSPKDENKGAVPK